MHHKLPWGVHDNTAMTATKIAKMYEKSFISKCAFLNEEQKIIQLLVDGTVCKHRQFAPLYRLKASFSTEAWAPSYLLT